MKQIISLMALLVAVNVSFAQQYYLKGNTTFHYNNETIEDADADVAVVSVSLDKPERIDVMNTNFIIKKERVTINKVRLWVRIPEQGCSQPLIVTSDNYEDCIIDVTSKLRRVVNEARQSYSVRLTSPDIKINHIVYVKPNVHENIDEKSKKMLKIDLNNKFSYLSIYQNEVLNQRNKNYTAIDINLRREAFDIENSDIILDKKYYPGKVRVVIDMDKLSTTSSLSVTTEHYKTHKISLPSDLKNKSLYNYNLIAPLCNSNSYVDPCIKHGSFDTLKKIEWIFVKGNGLIKDFYISKYEVTNYQFYQIMGYYISPKIPEIIRKKYRTDPNLPKTMVSWDEAIAFCENLSKKYNKKCTLPTVTQWVYAAQGGINQAIFKYSGSDKLDDVAWYYENAHEITQDVNRKKPNSLEIFGMTGNAKEWCMDDDGKDKKVIKGGSVRDGQYGVDTYLRIISPTISIKKTDFPSDLGFRVIYVP